MSLTEVWQPDIVVLDLMLPGIDGLEVCRRLRKARDGQHPLPVIMLTALGEESERVRGLETRRRRLRDQAVQPTGTHLARAGRPAARGAAGAVAAPPVPFRAGRYEVDVAARRIRRDGRELALTVREFDLLAFFIAHPGRAFTRTELLEQVWGWSFGDLSTITVCVRQTPRKGGGRANGTVAAADRLGDRLPVGGGPVVSAQIQVVLIAAACTSAVGLLGIGVMRLLRRASLRLSLQAGSAVAVLAIVAGTLGTAETMFISPHDLGVVVMVCVVAGIAAFGFCWLLGRQVETSSMALRHAARSLGHEAGGFRSPAVPMAAELAALSQELTATAAKLAESRARERRLEQSRRQLVAWVSHDLRTPLARLSAMAEALQDGIAADPGRYHRQIRAEVARLTGMVDDLFELSRIQSGTLQLSPDRIDLGDLVSDAVAGTEALARAKGVRLAGAGRRAAGHPTPIRASCHVRWPTCSSTPSSTPRRAAACMSRPRRRPSARC